MKLPTKRSIHFHGEYKNIYCKDVLEIHADSMFNLFNILFVNVFPELKKEKQLSIIFEDDKGNMTELFDPEQELHDSQKIIHILPNPDGAELVTIIIAIVVAVISIGIALLLAPKVDVGAISGSGANWESPENVVGQGGVIPVALGTRLVGSRVASYGIDTKRHRGRGRTSGGGGGGGGVGGGGGDTINALQK